MSLTLHYHPLASFCWKPLIALYENGIDFDRVIVDLGDPASTEAFCRVWPMLKFPVLRDEERDATVAESTTVIEYLDAFHPGPTRFVPDDADQAWQTRMWDRFFDNYVQDPMQKIVGDRLRAADERDPVGVEQARGLLRTAYQLADERFAGLHPLEAPFTLADCAAAPALFYAHTVEPIDPGHSRLRHYLARLLDRPSFRRVLDEAEPYFKLFPMDERPRARMPELAA